MSGQAGDVLVGSRDTGRVYGLIDADGDQYAERVRILVYRELEHHPEDPPLARSVRDDLPADTHHACRSGEHFGFPFCHGGTLADLKFAAEHGCGEFTPPAQWLAPHAGALGMRFYTGVMFHQGYRNQIFIAKHGSCYRTRRLGYRNTLVRLNAAHEAVSYQLFTTGWLQGEHAWGQPVDVLVMPDGALLLSDDRAGVVYRIRRVGTKIGNSPQHPLSVSAASTPPLLPCPPARQSDRGAPELVAAGHEPIAGNVLSPAGLRPPAPGAFAVSNAGPDRRWS